MASVERGWRWAVGILSVLLLAALVWGAWQWTERARAEAVQAAQFQRALFELIAQVEQTELLMAKSLVSGSDPRRAMLLDRRVAAGLRRAGQLEPAASGNDLPDAHLPAADPGGRLRVFAGPAGRPGSSDFRRKNGARWGS